MARQDMERPHLPISMSGRHQVLGCGSDLETQSSLEISFFPKLVCETDRNGFGAMMGDARYAKEEFDTQSSD